MDPIITSLALYYKLDKRLKVGRMDLTKNEIVHPNITIRSFPAFYLFLNDEKYSPIEYDGDRSVKMLTQFIADERTKYRKKHRINQNVT
jgi:hypothetical protein